MKKDYTSIANRKIVSSHNHIEIVHEDPWAAARFLNEVFGAVRVEQVWSNWIEKNLGIPCVHMKFGGMVIQYIKGNEAMQSWRDQLETTGNGIHNLSLAVNDLQGLRKSLLDRGSKVICEWPQTVDWRAAGFDKGGLGDAYAFDLTEECGFKFEMLDVVPEWEPGEQQTGEQFEMSDDYTPIANRKIVSSHNHIEIVHKDPWAAARFLNEVFGAVRVEQVWSNWIEENLGIPCVHMKFGGMVFQYIKGNEAMQSWRDQLETTGNGIHNLSLAVNDLQGLRKSLLDRGSKVICEWPQTVDWRAAGFDKDGLGDAYAFDLTEECGFKFEMLDVVPEWEPGEQQTGEQF